MILVEEKRDKRLKAIKRKGNTIKKDESSITVNFFDM